MRPSGCCCTRAPTASRSSSTTSPPRRSHLWATRTSIVWRAGWTRRFAPCWWKSASERKPHEQETFPMNPPSQDKTDVERLSPFQLFIFLVCLLIMLADGFDAAAMGYVVPALTREWGLAAHAFGAVLSASLVGLAAGALAAGPVADRVGRKPVLVLSVLAFGVFSLVCASAGSLTTLTIWRFLPR